MKKYLSLDLLDELQSETRKIILATTELLQEDPDILTTAPGGGRWSAAQVIEHLNSYGRYYLPAIQSALDNDQSQNPEADFKPGWLGDYFTKSMLPKNGQVVNKMKTPKDHRPQPDIDSKPVIETFLKQQQLLLELMEKAKHKDISRIRIPISLSKLVKLKLGDTFRFLVAHHQRHFVQIENTLKELTVNI